jgi:hypothetical protein
MSLNNKILNFTADYVLFLLFFWVMQIIDRRMSTKNIIFVTQASDHDIMFIDDIM